jgi:transcriptional regulator with AAA-type ATPase domain/tetratricopeptide (TPR) repeat protein
MRILADLVGDSPGIRAVRETVARLLARQSEVRRLPSILIQGETGTGKGLLARMIHRAGPRPDGPFIDVNCAAIPDTLLEAEMFGFERGAFTDARRSKPGLFQAAHRGTIFLDEVGLLPEGLQAKLLKVLEERTVRRLGATRDEPIDAWVVTATNEDLKLAIRERRFREDLYHRLAVLTVTLPPLRERGDDLVTLADHFLTRVCSEYGVPRKSLAASARAALHVHRWPGNVRELSNVIERAVLMSSTSEITAEALALGDAPSTAPVSAPPVAADAPVSLDDAMREHLTEVLTQTSWNISRTAALLGISRNTLRARMDKYGLRERDSRSAPRPRPATAPTAPVSEPATLTAAPAPAPTPLAGPTARRWERRRVALVRVALAPPAGPNASVDTARALETTVEKVRTFGGRVEGIGPIGLVAVFGLDAAGEAADRAAHAAMAVLKAAERARRDEASETVVRVGLHVAPVFVGVGTGSVDIDMDERRDMWQLVDDVVERAPVGGILVTATAGSLLTRRFELAPGPATTDRGPTHVLVGLERTGLGLGGRLAEFVGRRQELDLLQSRLAVAAAGRGQVIGIVGDAGIGKSRLVFEFRQSRANGPLSFLLGHCRAWSAAVPYLPLLEILRGLCGIAETDSAEDIVGKLDAAIGAFGMRADQRDVLLHFLGLKVEHGGVAEGAELDPQSFRTRLFEALRQLVIRRSRQNVVVLLLEDAHWIDRASEEYFASLVDAIAAAPIILIWTSRAGYRPPWSDKSFATQISLQPLEAAEGLTLARAVPGAEALDAAQLEEIAAKAEGNPFFLEELVRAAREQDPHSSLTVPDTVEDVLRSRIDRLDPEDQRLLQRAAVVGREAPLSILEAVEGPDVASLGARLLRLQAAEFLYEMPRGTEVEYRFKHALTHEVVYAGVEARARQALHARLVDVIERSIAERPGEIVDRLAHHAYHGEVWAKAVEYLREAGTRATARAAHREAVTAFERALVAVERRPAAEPAIAIDLRFDLRSSLLPLGEHQRIFDVLRQAEEIADTIGDRGRLGRVYAYLTNAFFISGKQQQGLEYGRRALAIAEELGDFVLQAEAKLRLGQVYHALGEYAQAVATLSDPVEALHGDLLQARFGLPVIFSVGCRTWLARAQTELGQFDEALRRSEEAVRIAEMAGHTYSLAVALWSIGQLNLRRGDREDAIAVLRRGSELARTWEIRVWITRFASRLGLALARAGQIDEGVVLLEQAVGQNLSVPDQAPFLVALAEGCALAGRAAEAQLHGERALDLAILYRDRGTEAWAHWLLGTLAADKVPLAAAASFSHALALATDLQMRPLVAHARLGLGRLAARAGEQDPALVHLTAARSLYAEMRMLRAAQEADDVVDRLG